LPMLLNLELAEPPIVMTTCGRVGDTTFNWELVGRKFCFQTTTQENQEKTIYSTIERFRLFSEKANPRLLAALHYFHIACRLTAEGNSPWEFMAESVLNLCKVLQVLFGEKRDDVRGGLAGLGYSMEEIERDFIPLMVLRDGFDVGHASLTIFKPENLEAIYEYLEDIESHVRDLLKCVTDSVQAGTYELHQEASLSPDREKRKEVEQLITSLTKWNEKRKV